APSLNISLQQIKAASGGAALGRALSQLRLQHTHILPLMTDGQPKAVLLLANKKPFQADESPQSQHILDALIAQASVAVDNARLLIDLEAHEEQMRVEQAFRKMVLDTMGDSLVVVDDQAIIRYVNNRLLRMTGYTRQELYGISVGV